jgi:hypothetical protein
MRMTILALFFCTCVAAMCQSMAPAPKASENSGEDPQHTKLKTDCNTTRPDFSMLSSATLRGDRQSDVPATWQWNDGQVDSKNPFHSLFADGQISLFADGQITSKNTSPSSPSNSAVQSCTLVAQWGQPNFYEMRFSRWPYAKLEPIPTQWPKVKLEPIPTVWPRFEMVPIMSRVSTEPTPRVP